MLLLLMLCVVLDLEFMLVEGHCRRLHFYFTFNGATRRLMFLINGEFNHIHLALSNVLNMVFLKNFS